ncbi:hypothetical protein V8C34DRAFT_88532 [Trichoderma compactum]
MHVPLWIHLISHFTSFPTAVICTTTGPRVLPSLLLNATSGWVGDGFPFDIKYYLIPLAGGRASPLLPSFFTAHQDIQAHAPISRRLRRSPEWN